MNRRDFLKAAIAATASIQTGPVYSAPAAASPRALWLTSHGESRHLDILTPADYQAACWLLRDWRTQKVASASLRLLETAAWMQAFLALYQIHRPFVVHSGYRTKFTNELVGGARASMHMLDPQGYFHAMDIHMNGVSAEYLGRLAALAHQGGVGFYTHRSQEFVHIDDGRVRYWRGNGKHKKRKT